MKNWMRSGVMAGAMILAPMAVMAQQQQAASMTGQDSVANSYTNEELVPLSVHEAWVKSGRNEDKFFDMVKQLAELSAQKRNVTLPDSADAGKQAGLWIKKEAKKDPDQLLYVVVDRAVQHVAKMQAAK